MIRLSDRHLLVVLLMLLVAAVPVAAHYVVGIRNEDCADPAALKRLTINGATEVAEWKGHYSYAVTQFTRGDVRGARFVWVRSWVPQPFYGERPFYTPGRHTSGPSQLEIVQVDGVDVPIRVWEQRVLSNVEITAILRIYRGRPVADVFEPSLVSAMDTLFNGPSPVDFVGITGAGHASNAVEIRRNLTKWLVGAWTHHLQSCQSP